MSSGGWTNLRTYTEATEALRSQGLSVSLWFSTPCLCALCWFPLAPLGIEVGAQNAEHAAQRFGGAPQELIAHGESADKFRSHLQFMNAANGNIQCAGNGGGGQTARRRFSVIGNDANPGIGAGQNLLDFGERHVSL